MMGKRDNMNGSGGGGGGGGGGGQHHGGERPGQTGAMRCTLIWVGNLQAGTTEVGWGVVELCVCVRVSAFFI